MIRRRALAMVAVVALLVGAVPSSAIARGSGSDATSYLIRMRQAPVAAYVGGIPGYRATAPRAGRKIDPAATDVARYATYLKSQHDKALGAIPSTAKVYDYVYALNGFAARLTPAQARRVAKSPGVVSVRRDALRKLDTSSTPDFLGLTGPTGAWADLPGGGGDGMIIGIIDSGIWPESASFTDGSGGKRTTRAYQKAVEWHGKCQPGDSFSTSLCNSKLIGARWYTAGWGAYYGGSGNNIIRRAYPFEFLSARDADGHGTHTASTAAGNAGIAASISGVPLGSISGMAPNARVAAYKVCWGADDGGCLDSDSVAAIDQAVADGVDVLNFSISGSTDTIIDDVEIAFLIAARAGIFVAASAGNAGPGASTVAHNSPWLMTVAAGTHDRGYEATVELGGATYTGIGIGRSGTTGDTILGNDAAFTGASAAQVELAQRCYSATSNGGTATLDPAKVAGKVVICDRGGNGRVDKSRAVKEAGGIGMLLLNTDPSNDGLVADFHSVPSVHLHVADRAAIRAAAGGEAELMISSGARGKRAPEVADFSSRGPALASGSDLLKPDILGPGVDVLAASSPAGSGRSFDILSGTSMSSPHLAGLAALVKQKHPTWTPSMVKSALMTTASQTDNTGADISGSPFDFGAGQVVPKRALDPGLVFGSGYGDWLGFLCGSDATFAAALADLCASVAGEGISLDPTQLNYPSIAVAELVGTKTIRRVVTNVSGSAQTFDVDVTVGGFDVAAPSSITVAAGASETVELTLTRTTAEQNEWVAGSLTFSNASYTVRSPIVVRPRALVVPQEVSIASGSDATSYPVTFGYDGSLEPADRGLIASDPTGGTLPNGGMADFAIGGTGVAAVPITIDASTTFARFHLMPDSVNAGADFDLYLCRASDLTCDTNESWVAASADGDSDERIDLRSPVPGDYVLYVHAWDAAGTTSPWRVERWLLGTASTGTIASAASPTSGSIGDVATVTVTLTASGLALPSGRYLGAIGYGGLGASAPLTIVRYDVP